MTANKSSYYLLKEVSKTPNLYVGTHWKTGCQLQELDQAYHFLTESEAENCIRNLSDFCGLHLQIIKKNI